jgi:hypothetical protein
MDLVAGWRYRAVMATMDDVERLTAGLPEVTEGTRFGRRTWFVGTKGFAWERPFSKADIKRFGEQPVPAGPILAVRTADLTEKDSVLAEGRPGFFTIPHFDGYPALLIRLAAVEPDDLREAVTDGWLAVAPPAVAALLDLS